MVHPTRAGPAVRTDLVGRGLARYAQPSPPPVGTALAPRASSSPDPRSSGIPRRSRPVSVSQPELPRITTTIHIIVPGRPFVPQFRSPGEAPVGIGFALGRARDGVGFAL